MLADHARQVHYVLKVSPQADANARTAKAAQLYIHAHRGRAGRSIDDSTEHFDDAPRLDASCCARYRFRCRLYYLRTKAKVTIAIVRTVGPSSGSKWRIFFAILIIFAIPAAYSGFNSRFIVQPRHSTGFPTA